MKKPGNPSEAQGWDTYWQGTRDGDSYASDGERHPAITAFWSETLGELLASGGAGLRILDIATGSGAVVESLFQHGAETSMNITCVDISEAAIDSVRKRFPAITGIVADARSIPLENSAYDLVTSQFGVEYAGPKALDEAARLLAPGGALALLMHIRPGVIYGECAANLDAVRRTQQSKFVERSLRFFEAGFAAVRGADREPYEKAGLALNPAIRQLESVLSDHGEGVAGGAISKLYTDVQRMHMRIQNYDPTEVIAWLQAMSVELDAYAERMASMCEAASDKKAFRALRQRLNEHGLTVVTGESLVPAGGSLPVAWILVATREG